MEGTSAGPVLAVSYGCELQVVCNYFSDVGSAKLRPGAAGRDPAALEQPDTLVIGRSRLRPFQTAVLAFAIRQERDAGV